MELLLVDYFSVAAKKVSSAALAKIVAVFIAWDQFTDIFFEFLLIFSEKAKCVFVRASVALLVYRDSPSSAVLCRIARDC